MGNLELMFSRFQVAQQGKFVKCILDRSKNRRYINKIDIRLNFFNFSELMKEQ